jgi:lipoprotein-releasing system permease protein
VIVAIATAAVAVSIAVMIISVAVVKGYQQQIKHKVTGFASHIQLSRLDLNNSFETVAIGIDTTLEDKIKNIPEVETIQPFAIKAGIIKTDEDFSGVVLKGINQAYKKDFLQQHLLRGRIPAFNDTTPESGILISSRLSLKMGLDTGDNINIYFVQDPPRARRFKVEGVFETGFTELDETYAFIDLKVIQKVNSWQRDGITGYEILLHNYEDIEKAESEIVTELPYYLEIQNIRQIYPQLFEWLALLDINVIVIIILMMLVACINMITALLILIVDRSQMIGIMKSIGARDVVIRKLFLNISAYLLIRGILIGNSVGIVMCYVQDKYKWIKLDPSAYYLDSVPIKIELTDVFWLNLFSIVICILAMLLPTLVVSRILPVKVLRFN